MRLFVKQLDILFAQCLFLSTVCGYMKIDSISTIRTQRKRITVIPNVSSQSIGHDVTKTVTDDRGSGGGRGQAESSEEEFWIPDTSSKASKPTEAEWFPAFGEKVTESEGAAIRIYKQTDFQGLNEILRIHDKECLNIPSPWAGDVGSIDTLGLCVLLWQSHDCKGYHKIIRGDEDDTDPGRSRLQVPPGGIFLSIELC